jgi:hypothetical protein
MLKQHNTVLAKEGSKVRMKLLFDIAEKNNYHQFFKAKFLKLKAQEDLVLKFTKC